MSSKINEFLIIAKHFIEHTKSANPNNRFEHRASLLREKGLEPSRTYIHMNLNHACLPIPAFPRTNVIIYAFSPSVNTFFIFIFGQRDRSESRSKKLFFVFLPK